MNTIAGVSTGKYTERHSRFLSFLFPIADESGFFENVNGIEKEHHSARHVCWAFRLPGADRCSDAGEPRGTAGQPLLDILVHHGIVRAGLVVVRYYGGVKLGTGNLSRAYRQAGENALREAKFVPLEWRILLTVTPSPERAGEVYAMVQRYHLCLEEQEFNPLPCFTVSVLEKKLDEILSFLAAQKIPHEEAGRAWLPKESQHTVRRSRE